MIISFVCALCCGSSFCASPVRACRRILSIFWLRLCAMHRIAFVMIRFLFLSRGLIDARCSVGRWRSEQTGFPCTIRSCDAMQLFSWYCAQISRICRSVETNASNGHSNSIFLFLVSIAVVLCFSLRFLCWKYHNLQYDKTRDHNHNFPTRISLVAFGMYINPHSIAVGNSFSRP